MTRAAALFALTLPACVVAKIGDGDPATRTETFPTAAGFVLGTFVDTTVHVDPTAEASLSLTCDSSLLDDLVIEIADGDLVLRDGADYALVPQSECHAEAIVPSLTHLADTGSGRLEVLDAVTDLAAVEATGSGGLVAGPVSACDLVLRHTGSGPLTLDGLGACSVEATTTGSGRTSLVGSADSADVLLTGSGGFGEQGFVVDVLTLTVTGSGGAELTVLQSVDVTLTGSGGAVLHGDPPDRTVDTSGSGEVTFP